ncbi:MAG: hypothetical protein FWH12_04510 [Treponema sp.]|nr:hypothetical protein [Treponema sp.]
MDEHEKEDPQKKGVLAGVIGAVKKGLDSILVPPNPPDSEDPRDHPLYKELLLKLSPHFFGEGLEIRDLKILRHWSNGDLNVTGRLINVQDYHELKEADLRAEVKLGEQDFLPMPVTGVAGIDYFQPSLMPIIDSMPVVHRILLEVSSTSYDGEEAVSKIQGAISSKYPHSRLIGRREPLVINDETPYCDCFISDRAADAMGKVKKLARFVRVPITKEGTDRDLDEWVSIRDYTYKFLSPENLYTVEFPDPKDLGRILQIEKRILRELVFRHMGTDKVRFLHKLFFRIKGSIRNIEPLEGDTPDEISFQIDFSCAVGILEQYRVSSVFTYAIDSQGSEGKVMPLRYLRHGGFSIMDGQSPGPFGTKGL